MSQHSRESEKVFGLGEIENEKQQDQFNSNEGTISSNENRKRSGTSGLKQQSRTDANYLSAVESGDMETAQRMVDEAANAAGSLGRLVYPRKAVIASLLFLFIIAVQLVYIAIVVFIFVYLILKEI